MSAHTAEPWITGEAGQTDVFNLYGPDDSEHAQDGDLVAIADYLTKANAARIVACVNACAGINPEAVGDLLAAAAKLTESSDRLTRTPFAPFVRDFNKLRAAVDKAKP